MNGCLISLEGEVIFDVSVLICNRKELNQVEWVNEMFQTWGGVYSFHLVIVLIGSSLYNTPPRSHSDLSLNTPSQGCYT